MSSTGSCNETGTSIDQKQKFCYQILVFNLSAEESVSKHTKFNGLSKSLKVCFYGVFLVNLPISTSVAFYVETRYFICSANQVTGFYMKCNTGLKWVMHVLNVNWFFVCTKQLVAFNKLKILYCFLITSTKIIHQLILNLNLTDEKRIKQNVFCSDDIGLSKFGNIDLEFSQNCFKFIIIHPVNP